KVEMEVAIDGRRRFRGLLLALEGEAARIHRDDAGPGEPVEVLLPIAEMAEARIMLSEAQIAAALKRAKAQQREHENDQPYLNEAGAASHDQRAPPAQHRRAAQHEG